METGPEDKNSVFQCAVRGDREAFARLLQEHQSMVFSIAYHFTNDAGVAEELAQEVFLEFHRALPGLECAAHAAAWLRRVTSHRCIDHVRRHKNRPSITLSEAPEPAHQPVFNDPMASERLRKLVAALPESARAILILRFQEDLDPSEISTALNIPLNTVKSHLQRSLSTLRAKWGKLGLTVQMKSSAL